jgi:hypothetical protein
MRVEGVEKIDVSDCRVRFMVTRRITPHLRRSIARLGLGRIYLFNTKLRRAADYIS